MGLDTCSAEATPELYKLVRPCLEVMSWGRVPPDWDEEKDDKPDEELDEKPDEKPNEEPEDEPKKLEENKKIYCWHKVDRSRSLLASFCELTEAGNCSITLRYDNHT